jgi:hypothetical protein
MEERIRRETADQNSPNVEQQTLSKSGKDDTNDIDIAQPADESFIHVSPCNEEMSPMHRSSTHDVFVTISIDNIQFHHPLFTKEEATASQIQQLYEVYREHIEAGCFHYLLKRLVVTTQFLLKDGTHFEKDSMSDLLSTANKLVAECSTLKDMYCSIEKLWASLLQAREESGFVCTDLELQTSPHFDFDQDAQTLMDTLPSLRPVVAAKCLQENDSLTINAALESVERILHSDLGHCKQVFNLTKSNKTAQLGWIPKEEKRRRRGISSECYFVRLLLDGHPVGESRRIKIEWPSFSLRLSHRFHCKLSEHPDRPCIQLFMAPNGFLPSHLICSVFVGIPQLNVARGSTERVSSVPTSDRYLFSNKNGLKGSILVSTTIESIPVTQTVNAPKVPRNLTSSKLVRSKTTLLRGTHDKRRIQSDSDVGISTLQQNVRQLMMAFRCNDKVLVSSSFKEPPRHILLKLRLNNPNVPSPIPISFVESTVDQTEYDYSSYLSHDGKDIQEASICFD